MSDPTAAYDARDTVWLISYLGLNANGSVDVVVSRSTNGGRTWGMPIAIAAQNLFFDKSWTVCDDTATSPFYGHCFTEFDAAAKSDQELMSTSTNGVTLSPVSRTPTGSEPRRHSSFRGPVPITCQPGLSLLRA